MVGALQTSHLVGRQARVHLLLRFIYRRIDVQFKDVSLDRRGQGRGLTIRKETGGHLAAIAKIGLLGHQNLLKLKHTAVSVILLLVIIMIILASIVDIVHSGGHLLLAVRLFEQGAVAGGLADGRQAGYVPRLVLNLIQAALAPVVRLLYRLATLGRVCLIVQGGLEADDR